ncbi:hypothetical protein CFP56_026895 [Quercus suber]|uniref:AIPP2-like SPOC-like domain-containing protein n=1 Tax=Quercus suber TaxID=58331 RepID=A0AAW0LW72_QUESU
MRPNVTQRQGIYTCEIIAFYIFTKFSLPSFFRGSILVAAKPGDIYRGLLAQTGDIYRGLRAQPPRTVSGRAYELSLRLPLTLRVMLLPRSQIWADLFQNDYPDLNDIALYFSPDDKIERSKESISCLSELMEDENLILRIRIEGVDLLIFTSKQLHVDSQSELSGFLSDSNMLFNI